jgi:hypothetical protein
MLLPCGRISSGHQQPGCPLSWLIPLTSFQSTKPIQAHSSNREGNKEADHNTDSPDMTHGQSSNAPSALSRHERLARIQSTTCVIIPHRKDFAYGIFCKKSTSILLEHRKKESANKHALFPNPLCTLNVIVIHEFEHKKKRNTKAHFKKI